jgi:hypothetical protein
MGSHLYGGAQQVLYLLEALSSSDVTSTLICPVGSAIGKTAREHGVAVEEIGYRGDLDWMMVPKIKRLSAPATQLISCMCIRDVGPICGVGWLLVRSVCPV